eukprot:6493011-Prymnesium_polylepis.1
MRALSHGTACVNDAQRSAARVVCSYWRCEMPAARTQSALTPRGGASGTLSAAVTIRLTHGSPKTMSPWTSR